MDHDRIKSCTLIIMVLIFEPPLSQAPTEVFDTCFRRSGHLQFGIVIRLASLPSNFSEKYVIQLTLVFNSAAILIMFSEFCKMLCCLRH